MMIWTLKQEDIQHGLKMGAALAITGFVGFFILWKTVAIVLMALKAAGCLFCLCWVCNQLDIFQRGSLMKELCDRVVAVGSAIGSQFLDCIPNKMDTRVFGIVTSFLLFLIYIM